MASVRFERRVAARADDVWALVADPARIVEWFPGVVAAHVEGPIRTLDLATGNTLTERILTVDRLARHFVYRLESEFVRFHLGAIDVIELGPDDTLCVYSTTAEPDTMALVIGGATADALDAIARIAEAEGGRGTQDPVHHD